MYKHIFFYFLKEKKIVSVCQSIITHLFEKSCYDFLTVNTSLKRYSLRIASLVRDRYIATAGRHTNNSNLSQLIPFSYSNIATSCSTGNFDRDFSTFSKKLCGGQQTPGKFLYFPRAVRRTAVHRCSFEDNDWTALPMDLQVNNAGDNKDTECNAFSRAFAKQNQHFETGQFLRFLFKRHCLKYL